MNVTAPNAYVAEGLDADVLELGLTAFASAWKAGETERFEYTVIDFSKPSDEHRQWTMDLADGSLLHSLLVAHGEGSGSDSDPRYADYATQDVVDEYGYLGRSWGCPAVAPDAIEALVEDVEDGALYWSYYPDSDFLADSAYL